MSRNCRNLWYRCTLRKMMLCWIAFSNTMKRPAWNSHKARPHVSTSWGIWQCSPKLTINCSRKRLNLRCASFFQVIIMEKTVLLGGTYKKKKQKLQLRHFNSKKMRENKLFKENNLWTTQSKQWPFKLQDWLTCYFPSKYHNKIKDTFCACHTWTKWHRTKAILLLL